MIVAGLDICKGYAVAWILDKFPADPRKAFKADFKSRHRDPNKDFYTFFFCHDVIDKKTGEVTTKGIDTFLNWGVDAVCMEPTGMRYSAFIAKVCHKHNIRIFWVNHSACKSFRENNDLPDKNDIADSFALACYAQLYGHLENSSYFIQFEQRFIPELRDLYMQHKFLTRSCTQHLNRIQQQLAEEFPEIALYSFPMGQSKQVDGRRPLVCEIAGLDREVSRKSPWAKKIKNSIAKEYGIEISQFSKDLASSIDALDLRLMSMEDEMRGILDH